MDATDFLRRQHREAMSLIEELEGRDGKPLTAADLQVFAKLKSALSFHTAVEEQILYHELANEEATKHLVHEAFTEHREVDKLLVKLSTSSPDQWGERLAELKKEIAHHVDEEENDLFPQAERLLGKSRLRDMGWQMEQIKKGKSARMGRVFRA